MPWGLEEQAPAPNLLAGRTGFPQITAGQQCPNRLGKSQGAAGEVTALPRNTALHSSAFPHWGSVESGYLWGYFLSGDLKSSERKVSQ